MASRAKRSKVVEEAREHIDGELVLAIEMLQEIQDEIEKVNEEASNKVLEVEQKYSGIRRPVYNRRNDTIQTIPEFWLTTFLRHPVIEALLTDEDQKILKYLQSLDVEDFKDVKSGYSISFIFSPNPYFENTKLTKAYHFSDDGTTNITGTTIKWKEGMDILQGSAHEKGMLKRPRGEDSFFSWFDETQSNVPAGVTDEVADIIKEDIWTDPLMYFNNEEADEEDFDEDDDDNDIDEEGSGQDDDDN